MNLRQGRGEIALRIPGDLLEYAEQLLERSQALGQARFELTDQELVLLEAGFPLHADLFQPGLLGGQLVQPLLLLRPVRPELR